MKRSYRIGITAVVAAGVIGGAGAVLAATQGAAAEPASVSVPQEGGLGTSIDRLRAETQALRSQVWAAEQVQTHREDSAAPVAVPVRRQASNQPTESTERPGPEAGEHGTEPAEHEAAAGEHGDD